MEKREKISQLCVAIVGMNAVGKTRFGKRLASKLQLKRVDIDTEFRRQFGKIDSYIEDNGWEVYRTVEAELILDSLKPGKLVVLGGGSLCREEVRNALNNRATVIWIRASAKRIARHIREAKRPRPEFKGRSPDKVAKQLLEERDPLYAEVADIELRSSTMFHQYLSIVLKELEKLQRE